MKLKTEILILIFSLFFICCHKNHLPVIEPLEQLEQLTGQWEEEDFSIIYPFVMDGREYLKVNFLERNDTELWTEYALANQLNIEEVWQKRYTALCQIYKKEFPYTSDSGIQKGVRLSFMESDGKTEILCSEEMLIPAELVEAKKELISFERTADNCKLLASDFINFYNSSLEIPASKGEYGIVLSGGGGKGAYQAGAWAALKEYGIAQKVTCISGASVGGLNAALFTCIEDPEKISDIWKTQVPGKLTKNDEILSEEGLLEIVEAIDVNPIESRTFPYVYVDAIKIQSLLESIKKGSGLQYFLLNHQNQQEIRNLLMATSAFPIVTNPVLLADGNYYLDGGNELLGGDNTPFYPITEITNSQLNIKTMFIISLNNDDEFYLEEKDTVEHLFHITPSKELGSIFDGVLNFSQEKILDLINLGYNDTVQYLEKKGYVPVSTYWFE